MGGSLTVAARFNNEETICVEGWTNFLPRIIINETTFSGDDSIVRSTLMEVANHRDYEGPCALRKSGYGIVVIDFPSREIHSIQGYCSFTDRSLTQLLDINATGWQGKNWFTRKYVNVLSERSRILLQNNRVKLVRLENNERIESDLTIERAMELLDEDAIASIRGTARKFYFIRIVPDPFVIHDNGEEYNFNNVKLHLREKGFPLTKAEGLNSIFSQTRNQQR